jgi:hypothetical protein
MSVKWTSEAFKKIANVKNLRVLKLLDVSKEYCEDNGQ